MKLSVALLLVAALSVTACDVRVDENGIRGLSVSEGRAEDVWTRTYALPPDGSLDISADNGTITVRGGDSPQVEVRAERQTRANTAEEARTLLEKLQIREDVSPTSVKLTTVGGESTWAPPGFGRRAMARVEYHVQVPAGLALILETENGSVRLHGVNGRVSAMATNGGITGDDVGGGITAETVNGAIRVNLASVTGDVALSTTNGGVRLTLPTTGKASLEASVVNGGIDIDDEFGLDNGEGRSRSVNAAMNGGGPKVSARSVNGGIRIRARGRDSSD
jgi:hypothetical protein